jgi:glycine cleavage system T protein (aminomethyltransferase)
MLRGLVLDGREVPAAGAAVLDGDADVGRITSSTWSFGLERPIALALIHRKQAVPGTALDVAAREGTRVAARVSDLPFAR